MRKASYLWLLVPFFGLTELALHVFFAHRAPTPEQWAGVRPLVASWYRAGDVVVVAPYWAEPMARWKFGDALMPTRDMARPDVTRYGEALELSIFGSRSPELSGWKVARQEKSGPFTLRAVTNPAPPMVTYDFVDHLDGDSAEVFIEQSGDRKPCLFTTSAAVEGGGLGQPPIFPAARFACPSQPSHVFVGITIIDDEQMHPRRCIWSHPPGEEAELVTRFRNVPLAAEIRGHVGMGWHQERALAVPPFRMRIKAGGIDIGAVLHQAGDFWKSFELPLGAAANTRADVEFHVSAPPGGTHVCFEADSR